MRETIPPGARGVISSGSMAEGVSVVVPVHDEEASLPALHERLAEALGGTGRRHEIVYVDDGSKDRSLAILEDLASGADDVVVIQLARNFGQTAALSAGIDAARHEIVVTLDADLQNDPADIPRLLARLDEGADVVSGWRRHRQDPFFTRVVPSRIANWIIGRMVGVPLHDFGCTLKAYRRRLFDSFRLYGEMHRFVPAYAAWAGGRVAEVVVAHAPRRAGRSKYGIGRTLKVLLDLITVKFLVDYGTKPLYLFGAVGLASCALGVLAGATTLVQRALDAEAFVHRNPLILLAVFLFLLGVQSLMLGLLAEIGMRTHHEVRGGRAYVVTRVIGRAAGGPPPA